MLEKIEEKRKRKTKNSADEKFDKIMKLQQI